MTKDEALKQALEFFETMQRYKGVRSNIFIKFEPTATGDYFNLQEFDERAKPIITAIKQALAQTAPVQTVVDNKAKSDAKTAETRADTGVERGGQLAPVLQPQAYTTGHCKRKAQPGGCQLHNLHCSYPACDRKAATPPAQPAPTAQEPVACKKLCELCVKRGYDFCANAAKTTPITITPPAQTPTVQEPVGKVIASVPHLRSISVELLPEALVPSEDSLIYTTPPAAQPAVPLTEPRIVRLWREARGDDLGGIERYTRVVEAAHGITEKGQS